MSQKKVHDAVFTTRRKSHHRAVGRECGGPGRTSLHVELGTHGLGDHRMEELGLRRAAQELPPDDRAQHEREKTDHADNRPPQDGCSCTAIGEGGCADRGYRQDRALAAPLLKENPSLTDITQPLLWIAY